MTKWELAKLAYKMENYMDAIYYCNFCIRQNCRCGKDISILRMMNENKNLFPTTSLMMKKGSEKAYENNKYLCPWLSVLESNGKFCVKHEADSLL